jgi:O-antigen ligase
LWLELLAVLAALAWLWIRRPGQSPWPRDRLLWLVAGLVVLVPLLQLVPLPPQIWHNLPGREAELAGLQLVGAGDSWQPLSTSPMRTLASLLSLGPPLLVLAMAAALNAHQRRWLVATVAALALLSALVGTLQLAGGNGFRLYDASPRFLLIGFQANRNAEADVLLIGMLALAALAVALPGKWGAGGRRHRPRWLIAAGFVLALATVLTASRMGIALIPVVLLCAAMIVAYDPERRWPKSFRTIAAVALAAIVLVLALLQSNVRLQGIAARFGLAGEGRAELWSDSLYVLAQYWPVGSGMGTFVPNFIAAEPLEAVDLTVPNRAHNDFLELAIEAGLPGLLALAAIAALLVVMALRAWRQRPEDRPQVLFGVAVLLVIGLHSLVDYPLRSMALACFAALGAAMLAAPPPRPDRHLA